MSDSMTTLDLARLRRKLDRLEPRRALAEADRFTLGHPEIDHALGNGLIRGRLHEVFAEAEDAASATGFIALLAFLAGLGKPLLWLRSEAVQTGAGLIHATGLAELGLDPAALLLGLAPDEPALLRAAAEGARCSGLGAVLVECCGPMRGLDLTASRRLMLAAEISGVTVLILRVAASAPPSAADTRWRAAAAPSLLLEADAPGAPMFTLELLRRRAGAPAGPWRVEWNRDRSCFQEPDEGGKDRNAQGASLSGSVLPLVPLRTAEALRRAG